MFDDYEFPEFRVPSVSHGSLAGTKLPLVRVNRLLVRPYQPKNQTDSGLYVARSVNAPAIWAHVLAYHDALLNYLQPQVVVPGDLILFHRLSDEEVMQVMGSDGEKLSISVIHVDSIQAIVRPPLVPMRT